MFPATFTLPQLGPVRLSRRSLLNLLSALCLGLSLFLFGQSAWIFVKAQLAQVLLERAFSQSIVSGQPVKAWGWADTWPVARIEIQRIQASAIVLHGSSGEALAFGPALLNETSRIGERGTAVISAHRDTHFAFLKDVVVGDRISITRDDGLVFTYRVTGTSVARFDASGIDPHSDEYQLVLSTCWPLDAITPGPLRYLVHATLSGFHVPHPPNG